MPPVEKHAPGDFCWIELATTDHAAAKKFYSELFGWSIHEFPKAPNNFFAFKMHGRDVAAACSLPTPQQSQGVPAHWKVYIAVENADAAAGRAAELGAKLLAAPFDKSDVGRVAILQDPSGAVFSVWQAKRFGGFGIKGVPGAFCAADLSTPYQEAASRFYEQLFGWRVGKEDENPAHNYYHLFNHNEFIGGILPPAFRDPAAPPYWQIYLQVSDCEVTATKASSLGAQLYMPPMPIEDIGRMAVIADPQGAAFAILEAGRR
ncbi:MAG TPA: VOC family protein [Candidatus Dormibacteraeota bacterium]|nr:VOC family protein [Candidatus Dormibacteraeota bacterium]